MTPTTPRARQARGYSLVEVLLAAGLLASVLMAISGLFVMGSQSVRSGRELTKATTLANSVMEQAQGWNYGKVYGMAGAAGTETNKTWATDGLLPAYAGSADDIADWTATANAWVAQVESEFENGVLTYQVDGIGALPLGGVETLAQFDEADFLRVTVTVQWTEARGRARHVTFQEFVL